MGTVIDGVTLHPLRQIHVEKGDLWHALRSTDEGFAGFGEAYFTQILPGETKGWKLHRRCCLNLVVCRGAVRFTVHDDREGSATRGSTFSVTLSAEGNYQRLTVAPGLWMAFSAAGPEGGMLIDFIPEPHDPAESERLPLSAIPLRQEGDDHPQPPAE